MASAAWATLLALCPPHYRVPAIFCSGLLSLPANSLQVVLGGEVFAFREMLDHMTLLKEFYGPFSRVSSGLVGMEDCESLFTHLKNREVLIEKYLVRHFLGIQQSLEEGELENAYWIPGTENPADGLTKLRSEMGPILALLETGSFQPGVLRPLKELASRE